MNDEPSRKGPLAALLILLAMVAVGLYISHRLRDAAAIQDCVASGRSNCAPIEAPNPG
jgi:hypothetical protein